MFSNRDYVFNRRYLIDQEKNIIVIINRSTEHHIIPEKPQIHRVKTYWSFMVIKADSDIDKVSDCIVSETLVLKLEVSEN
jgi:ABC-type phosphate/phosphonate transport system substrate-binding protein